MAAVNQYIETLLGKSGNSSVLESWVPQRAVSFLSPAISTLSKTHARIFKSVHILLRVALSIRGVVKRAHKPA